MMPDNLRDALLTHCLDELEAGVSLEKILQRFPEQAADIEPVLIMAQLLQDLPGEPSAAAQSRAQDQFLQQAETVHRREKAPRPASPWWQRLAFAFGVIVLLFAGTLLLSSAAYTALPGDVLFPVKRAGESIRQVLASPAEQEILYHLYQERRIEEIIILMETGREANVQGHGYIEEMNGDTWLVYGIEMQITDETEFIGDPQVGSEVRVEGLVRDGQYFVQRMTVVNTPTDEPPDVNP